METTVQPPGQPPGQPDRQAQRCRADRARQVADVLRRQVLAGTYDGRPLPSESELGTEFGTTRNAIRAALDILRAEGLVDRVPGVGTVVATRKHAHELHRLQGLAETFTGRGTVVNEVRALTLTRPPVAVASRLGLAAGEDVVYVERLRMLDGVPLSLDLTYLVPDLGAQLLGRDLSCQDIFVLLEEVSGRPLGHAELVLEAVNADPHTAAVLGAARGSAVLMLERLTHLDDGRPVDLEYIRFRGDRLALSGITHRELP